MEIVIGLIILGNSHYKIFLNIHKKWFDEKQACFPFRNLLLTYIIFHSPCWEHHSISVLISFFIFDVWHSSSPLGNLLRSDFILGQHRLTSSEYRIFSLYPFPSHWGLFWETAPTQGSLSAVSCLCQML